MKYFSRFVFVSFLVILNITYLNAQLIDILDFGKVPINAFSEKMCGVEAETNSDVKVISAEIIGDSAFEIASFTPQTIKKNTAIFIPIRFSPTDNIDYFAYILLKVRTDSLEYVFVSYFKGNGSHDNPIYSPTDNLKGAELVTWLSNFVKPHKIYSYKDARIQMWSTIDNVNGEVECIYTGRKVKTNDIPDVNTTKFNTEHTWPQSLGADSEPEKSDLYHIRPTYEPANSKRGSFPFDFVTSGVTYQDNGSKLGVNAKGATVFEPRDAFKGDIARGLYYFAIRYNNPTGFINSQEEALKTFAHIDPVDGTEYARSQAIFAYQQNHNPFVEYPSFINRFNTIAHPDFTKQAILHTADDTIYFKNADENWSWVRVLNLGDTLTKISNIEMINPSAEQFFTYSHNVDTLRMFPHRLGVFRVTLHSLNNDKADFESQMKITYENNETNTIVLKTQDIILSVPTHEIDNHFSFEVYPNPITNTSHMKLNSGLNFNSAKLSATTLDGRTFDLSRLINSNQSIIYLNKQDMPCVNCSLFLNLEINNQKATKPIIIE